MGCRRPLPLPSAHLSCCPMAALLLLALLTLQQHDDVTAAATMFTPVAMGVNGHPFSQPNYMVGTDFVASGSAAGISYEQQLDEVAALAPRGGQRFFYRVDLNCGRLTGTTSGNAMRATQRFVRAAASRKLTVLPILFPDLGRAPYADHAAVTAAAQASVQKCAAVLVGLGITTFEIGQEWDNLALLPGRGGDKATDYNQTVYTHLLAVLRGMSAGVRSACSRSSRWQCEIGVNNGGWLHWWWFEMLMTDKLDFTFIAYHWYSEMGDINSAGGEDVWAKLISFGKDIWITELDRRGGSSARAPCTHPICGMDQPTYLQHETNLLVKLSRNASNQLKAVFIYEMFDEPHQGNAYPQTCATGNTSRNGESCYGLVGTSWTPGPRCDQYPSCNFSATKRKPAFAVVQQLARQLSTPPPAPPTPPIAPKLARCKARAGNVEVKLPDVRFGSKWVPLVNRTFGGGLACPTDEAALRDAGIASCDVGKTYEGMVTFRFMPGQFDLTQQMFLPADTAIVGAANPNHPHDHRKKPDVASNTYFVGTTRQAGNDWVQLYGGMKPIWSRGFVMNNRTLIANISVQGSDITRRSHEYTGGAAFELPGCNAALVSADGMSCDASRGHHEGVSANGEPVHDVRIEGVRINDLYFDHGPRPYFPVGCSRPNGIWNGSECHRDSQGHYLGIRATQGLFYSGMVPGNRAHRNITLSNAVSMFSWADGVNVHGHVDGFYATDLFIETPGDDAIGLWGVGDRNTPLTNVHFHNVYSYDTGHEYVAGACMKAFGVGPNVTFTGDFVCCSQPAGMGRPQDPDHGGVAVWLSPCCTADWDPRLHGRITMDADFTWATMGNGTAAPPHDMCTEKRCNNGTATCNPWLVGDVLVPANVRLPASQSKGHFDNTGVLVLTSSTLESCPGPSRGS